MQKRKKGQPHKGWKAATRKSHRSVDPALKLQRQEARRCTCDATGSGEGHALWCSAEIFDRIPRRMTAERALNWLSENR